MTNKYQRIATGTLDYDDVNFRILKGDVEGLIRGTRCQLFDILWSIDKSIKILLSIWNKYYSKLGYIVDRGYNNEIYNILGVIFFDFIVLVSV